MYVQLWSDRANARFTFIPVAFDSSPAFQSSAARAGTHHFENNPINLLMNDTYIIPSVRS